MNEKLGIVALSGLSSWIIRLASALAVYFSNINSAWIVLGAAILGWLLSPL